MQWPPFLPSQWINYPFAPFLHESVHFPITICYFNRIFRSISRLSLLLQWKLSLLCTVTCYSRVKTVVVYSRSSELVDCIGERVVTLDLPPCLSMSIHTSQEISSLLHYSVRIQSTLSSIRAMVLDCECWIFSFSSDASSFTFLTEGSPPDSFLCLCSHWIHYVMGGIGDTRLAGKIPLDE